MSELGELFHKIRKSKNWSLREAAKNIGISYSYLSVLERGMDPRTQKHCCPKPETLKIISKAYQYPYDKLMRTAGYIEDGNATEKARISTKVLIDGMNTSKVDFQRIGLLKEEVQKWLIQEADTVYLEVAMEAQKEKVSPDELRQMIKSVQVLQSKDSQEKKEK